MILPTLPRKMRTKVDTGTCRSARTLKPVYCKMTTRLLRTTPNKPPMMKNKLLKEKKLSMTPPDMKTQNLLREKGNVYPSLLKSAVVLATAGQRYTETYDC